MRCPGCNKFAALEFQEPEVEVEIDEAGTVSVRATLSRTSECCGEEMKTAELEMEDDLSGDLEGHIDDGSEKEEGKEEEEHELSVEETSVEPIEESSGGSRPKSFFGVRVSYAVTCSCQKKDASPLHEGTLEDKVAASAMDEAC